MFSPFLLTFATVFLTSADARIRKGCTTETPIVIDDLSYDEYYDPHHVTYDAVKDVNNPLNYWLGPDYKPAHITFDFGCVARIHGIAIRNSHHDFLRNRGTKKFTVEVAKAEKGPWTMILKKDMEDNRQPTNPPRLVTYKVDKISARYVRFRCTLWYQYGCALHYFGIL